MTGTATVLLIRHAAHGQLGRVLSGRTPDLALSEQGLAQAEALAERLSSAGLDVVQSSPLLRARQTADALARRCGTGTAIMDGLQEIDFGGWTGRNFADLEDDAGWQHWNSARAVAIPPGGEAMTGVQGRVMAHLRETALRHAGQVIAMVSHCDVIRAAIAGILGLPLDHVLRFDINPASISRVVVGDWGARVMSMNEEAG
ncbi:histidine phosphatase family protein [Croceicoccus sp. F390]|uniref:Histidine phosphatase family protein n=1 Tax=Croceicoccus esteveae TaxID=3075597 RepID=A0ABU2ZGX7_9SPHN|nr:histidine phosphatase family protein [Croceicoccus sp. F390]MDT0575842.1 histidine phosphatase family protein [Croceicoccus sp. F390]